MTPILRVDGLSVAYRTPEGPASVVHEVDLTLNAGETLGLAGESGCGKTTLAMSVLRLLPRTAEVSGSIELDGKDVRAMSFGQLRAARWSDASVVFQGAMHALNPVRTIADQIAEPIRLHSSGRVSRRELRRRVGELLQQVELPTGRMDAYPHELSGGQKQRVMIAMALACDPRLIIADEPTTALDVVVQAQVLSLLRRLVAEHDIALLMISHDLSVLSASCARLAVMYDGRIVEHGDAAQLMAAPVHEHSQALARAFPTVGDPAFRYVTEQETQSVQPGSGILRTHEVSVTFSGRSRADIAAVRSAGIDVAEDEILALVGQSGSGKTTLARTLLGLQRPTSGRVLFDGRELPTSSRGLREYRKTVQLVLQDPTGALNPRHTVYEAVAEGLRIHGETGDEHARVVDALETAELRPAAKYLTRFPQELSGGQRQRVVIAGALVLAPRVLVADEPVASLDATVRGEIVNLLLTLRRERGLSSVIITHDLGLAWNIANRVAVMYRGEIVETGTVEQVLLDPQHEYTKTLLAAVPALGCSEQR